VGAIYLDQGLAAVESVFEPLIGPEVARTLEERSDKDAKSRLQELVQGRLHRTPRYSTVAESGPDHAKEFTVEVTIGPHVYGRGIGPSKRLAAMAAAQEAVERLEKEEV
jgi:ribonuclease-3